MNFNFIFWCLVALFFILFELGMPGLFLFLSFAFGAIGSAVTSLFLIDLNLQLAIFIGVSLISLFLLTKFVKSKTHKTVSTNVYALVGKECIVVKDVGYIKAGSVEINGETWSARSVNKVEVIKFGDKARVVSVSGVHVIIKKIKE